MTSTQYKKMIVSNYRELQRRMKWEPTELTFYQFAGIEVFVETVLGDSAVVSCYVSRNGNSRLNYQIIPVSELSPE